MSTVTSPVPLVFGDYALEDRYRLDKGRVYLTGIQALVRLPMMQKQRDMAAGLNTGGFISGYRGSPLGMYDNALWGAKKYLQQNNIHFQPGLNEDLAATSVWGSQQVNLFPGAKVDGVFSIWYGKGPGVDRSMDVLKHGNAAGTSPHGGVIALALHHGQAHQRLDAGEIDAALVEPVAVFQSVVAENERNGCDGGTHRGRPSDSGGVNGRLSAASIAGRAVSGKGHEGLPPIQISLPRARRQLVGFLPAL